MFCNAKVWAEGGIGIWFVVFLMVIFASDKIQAVTDVNDFDGVYNEVTVLLEKCHEYQC